jgi:hypothetical protein
MRRIPLVSLLAGAALVAAAPLWAAPPKDPLAQEPQTAPPEAAAPEVQPPLTLNLDACRAPHVPKAGGAKVSIALKVEDGEPHTYRNTGWTKLGSGPENNLITASEVTVEDIFKRLPDGRWQVDVVSSNTQLSGTLPQPILDIVAQLDDASQVTRLTMTKAGVPEAVINAEAVAKVTRERATQVRAQIDSLFDTVKIPAAERESLNGVINALYLDGAMKTNARRVNEGMVNGNLDYFITSGRSFQLGAAQTITQKRVGEDPVDVKVWPLKLEEERLTVCYAYRITYKPDPDDVAEEAAKAKKEGKTPEPREPVDADIVGAVTVRISDGLPVRVERHEKSDNKGFKVESITVSELQVTL